MFEKDSDWFLICVIQIDQIDVEKPYEFKMERSFFIFQSGIRLINQDVESKGDRITGSNFAEGIVRNDPLHGTVYDLYFRSPKSPDIFKRVKLFRPFGPVQQVIIIL